MDVVERSIMNIFEQIKNDKKKILLIFDDTKIKKSFRQSTEALINGLKADNQVDIYSKKELEKAPVNAYNVVLELPFASLDQSNENRKYLISDFSYEFKNQYFGFVCVDISGNYEIFKMKLQNLNRINIVNLCSNYYSNLFFNKNEIPLLDKIRKYFNGNLEKNNKEPISKLDLKSIDEKKKELFAKYDKNLIRQVVELIKNNSDLKNMIFHKFIKNKGHLLWENKNINASMINGKKGIITVKLIPPTKQREE